LLHITAHYVSYFNVVCVFVTLNKKTNYLLTYLLKRQMQCNVGLM